MKKMSIYEPPMCCETGVCGVGVDPELLRVAAVLRALKKNGVEVKRYNLNNAPAEFTSNKIISNHINEKGTEGFPAIVIDEGIVIAGRYPTNEEFVELLAIPESYLPEAKPAQREGGCCPGEKCC